MDEFSLTADQQRFLLSLARETIRLWLRDRRKPSPVVEDEVLTTPCGAFVTLTTARGDLRGCIGHVQARSPLFRTVIECAVSAAFEDPRFPPLAAEELPETRLEISALSPLRRIGHIDEIEVGRHGLILTKGFSRGLLLPQVAARNGWDRETFLEHTCMKAGLPRDAWKEGAVIEVFTALVFEEE